MTHKEEKGLRTSFEAAINEHFGINLGKHHSIEGVMPQQVRVVSGIVIVRTVLRHG